MQLLTGEIVNFDPAKAGESGSSCQLFGCFWKMEPAWKDVKKEAALEKF